MCEPLAAGRLQAPAMSSPKRQRADDEGAEGDKTMGDAADAEVDLALSQVMELQDRLEKITDEASDRVLAIEQEYTKKRRPVYKERNEALRSIPTFWCQTLSKHPSIQGMLTDDDIEVLNHCTELDVEDFEDIKRGFKITLTFDSSNPYFTNPQLSKSFHYAEDGALSIKGTLPDWAADLAPADEEGAVGTKRPAGRDYRFMLWFMDEELEPGSHDELADIIREDIWPNPTKYYAAPDVVEEGNEAYDEDEALEGVAEGEVEEDEYAAGEYDEVYEGAEAGAAGEGTAEEGAGEEEGEQEEGAGEEAGEGEEA